MSDNKLMGTNEMWKGRESDALHIMTILMQEKVRGMRISELNPDTLRKRIGEEASKLVIPRELLLNITKVIVRQVLNEVLSEIENLRFSK